MAENEMIMRSQKKVDGLKRVERDIDICYGVNG